MQSNIAVKNTLWGSAFSKQPSAGVLAFTAGRDVVGVPPADSALVPYDTTVNMAHCVMLAKQGIIPVATAAKIVTELGALQKLVTAGKFILDPAKEDVHTNIESWLTKQLGMEIAGQLHTARSRNDQVATDMALYLKDQTIAFVQEITALISVLLVLAKHHQTTIIPGFTHHQHAMVTTLGHICLGFASMILHDAKKVTQWMELHDVSPLGSIVSYGTSHPIDSAYIAALLGFAKSNINSLDMVMNRWEAEADLAYALSSLMNHCSSIAETLILWATPEFGMISLADQYSTGSSIMPQKKNPDPLEVIKAKTSVVHGCLSSLLGIGKANFIGYNRDTQWTKYLIMDVIHECAFVPSVLAGVLQTLIVHTESMAGWCTKNFIGATTVMEQLTATYHVPMRQAKIAVEKAVLYSKKNDTIQTIALHKALKELHIAVSVTKEEISAWQDPKTSISLTKSAGGPGKQAMKQAFVDLAREVAVIQSWLAIQKKNKKHAQDLLEKAVQTFVKKGNI
ncbi:MAG: argininosuccinate lyase [Microgenomates group bacterium]